MFGYNDGLVTLDNPSYFLSAFFRDKTSEPPHINVFAVLYRGLHLLKKCFKCEQYVAFLYACCIGYAGHYICFSHNIHVIKLF